MGEFDYESLLDRAEDRIPKDISERARWTMPELQKSFWKEIRPYFRNFSSIVDSMDRDANHVYQFLINELGLPAPRILSNITQRKSAAEENQGEDSGLCQDLHSLRAVQSTRYEIYQRRSHLFVEMPGMRRY